MNKLGKPDHQYGLAMEIMKKVVKPGHHHGLEMEIEEETLENVITTMAWR